MDEAAAGAVAVTSDCANRGLLTSNKRIMAAAAGIFSMTGFFFSFFNLIWAEPTRMFARKPITIINTTINASSPIAKGLLYNDSFGEPAACAGCMASNKKPGIRAAEYFSCLYNDKSIIV